MPICCYFEYMGLDIVTATGGIAATNAYLVGDSAARVAVLIDAPDHTAATLLEKAKRRKWNLIGLWLTHGHFDHLADHAEVWKAFPGAKLLIHELDEPKLRNPKSVVFPLPFIIPPGVPDGNLTDGQKLKVGAYEAQVIHTPGHSPGHVMFYFPDPGVLIGGDLIIGGAVGRTDLPDANEKQLQASIRRVMKLPGNTRLLSGHGPPTTLSHEQQTNPYVQRALEEPDET